MESIADLKRMLKVGQKVTLIYSANPGHKFLNVLREVTKTQSNGVYFATVDQQALNKYGSFLDFPKRDYIEFTDKGWIVFDDEFTSAGQESTGKKIKSLEYILN